MSGKWCAREHEHEHEHEHDDDVREGGGGHGQGARGAVRTQEKFEPVRCMGEASMRWVGGLFGVCHALRKRCFAVSQFRILPLDGNGGTR